MLIPISNRSREQALIMAAGDTKLEDLTILFDKLNMFSVQSNVKHEDITCLITGPINNVQKIIETTEREIAESKRTLKDLRSELTELEICRKQHEEEVQQATKVIQELKHKENAEKKELEDIQTVNRNLKLEIEHLQDEARPVREDVAIIDKKRKLLTTYKDLTGIKWDYTVPSKDYTGIIYNRVKNHIKSFSFDAMDGKEEVWKEIEKSSHASWSDITLEEITQEKGCISNKEDKLKTECDNKENVTTKKISNQRMYSEVRNDAQT